MNRIVILVTILAFGGFGLHLSGMLSASNQTASLETQAEANATEAEQPPLPFRQPTVSSLTLVDKAYLAAGRRRTKFDPTNNSIRPSEREYLTEIFAMIDQSIAWRISGIQALHRPDPQPHLWADSGLRLLEGIELIQPPARAQKYHALIRESVAGAQIFFHKRAIGDNDFDWAQLHNEPEVARSSAAARAAYRELQQLYPARDAQAECVFYDTVHALDFL